MSRIDFANFIEDPTYIIGNSSIIHEQIKAALVAESDPNTNGNFVLQQSNIGQQIQSDLFVSGNFTSGSMTTAGFDVNGDGTVDFTSNVTFQPGSLVQEYIADGYCDLANDQTIDGIKYFKSIKMIIYPQKTMI